jgi:sulfur relay (sulfurtransferase) DsrC/TusE family protein
MKAAGKAIELAHAEAVAKAEALTPHDAEALSNQAEALTPAQMLQLERYYLGQFYRVDVDADLVVFDRNGRKQQEIKSLERLLNSQIATDRTASTINHNSDNPQDWSRAAVRSWLYEQSGFSDLVRSIVAGEVDELTEEHTGGVVAFVRAHHAEFKAAIGNYAKATDQQLVGEMLRRNAIPTIRQTRRNAGQLERRYRVDHAQLAGIMAIISRRQKVDPPIGILGLDQGGGSSQNPPEVAGLFTPEAPIEFSYEVVIDYGDGVIERQSTAA